jgi:hypothetical protein
MPRQPRAGAPARYERRWRVDAAIRYMMAMSLMRAEGRHV